MLERAIINTPKSHINISAVLMIIKGVSTYAHTNIDDHCREEKPQENKAQTGEG